MNQSNCRVLQYPSIIQYKFETNIASASINECWYGTLKKPAVSFSGRLLTEGHQTCDDLIPLLLVWFMNESEKKSLNVFFSKCSCLYRIKYCFSSRKFCKVSEKLFS